MQIVVLLGIPAGETMVTTQYVLYIRFAEPWAVTIFGQYVDELLNQPIAAYFHSDEKAKIKNLYTGKLPRAK